ncbi:MAG: zinc ribbon domain-containing protein [Candidatus Aminicenantes bacterium]
MPIYEFSCNACGCSFETLTSIGGEKKVTCVKCGSKDIQKLISSFGIGGGGSRMKSSSSSCDSCTATSCATCK